MPGHALEVRPEIISRWEDEVRIRAYRMRDWQSVVPFIDLAVFIAGGECVMLPPMAEAASG
jgi:hypothetical protein